MTTSTAEKGGEKRLTNSLSTGEMKSTRKSLTRLKGKLTIKDFLKGSAHGRQIAEKEGEAKKKNKKHMFCRRTRPNLGPKREKGRVKEGGGGITQLKKTTY